MIPAKEIENNLALRVTRVASDCWLVMHVPTGQHIRANGYCGPVSKTRRDTQAFKLHMLSAEPAIDWAGWTTSDPMPLEEQQRAYRWLCQFRCGKTVTAYTHKK